MSGLDKALCAGDNPGIWTEDDPAYDPPLAKAICKACPAADECLARAYADEGGVDAKQRTGIRAGTTPAERARAARKNARGQRSGGLPDWENSERMRLYEQGLSDARIGALLGVRQQSIEYWRKKRGLKSRYEFGDRAQRAMNIQRHQLHAKGWDDAQIAAAMSSTVKAVREWRRRNRLAENVRQSA